MFKKPDSAFSQGVEKVDDQAELSARLAEFFAQSELLIAQQFLPTTFDWRIGILDRQPLYACKYYMAKGHWQIIQSNQDGKRRYGSPRRCLSSSRPSSCPGRLESRQPDRQWLIRRRCQGVRRQFYVIEVNDNPNLDSKYEDAMLKDELYRRIMKVFLKRIEQRKAGIS